MKPLIWFINDEAINNKKYYWKQLMQKSNCKFYGTIPEKDIIIDSKKPVYKSLMLNKSSDSEPSCNLNGYINQEQSGHYLHNKIDLGYKITNDVNGPYLQTFGKVGNNPRKLGNKCHWKTKACCSNLEQSLIGLPSFSICTHDARAID
jgi:hypothetical protein